MKKEKGFLVELHVYKLTDFEKFTGEGKCKVVDFVVKKDECSKKFRPLMNEAVRRMAKAYRIKI